MQQTKEALFGAPCTPVIDEEEPCTRKRARRHTVTNETPSYSQKELASFTSIITDLRGGGERGKIRQGAVL